MKLPYTRTCKSYKSFTKRNLSDIKVLYSLSTAIACTINKYYGQNKHR